MNIRILRALYLNLAIVVVLLISSCGGDNSSNKNHDESEASGKSSGITDGQAEVASHPGKSVYQKYCLTCHQADGSGVPGMFPPLSPNEWIANKDKIIELLLNGQSGEITVNGEVYNNLMPAHDFLSDQQIADVISYVRTSFGNDLDPVTKEDVAAAR